MVSTSDKIITEEHWVRELQMWGVFKSVLQQIEKLTNGMKTHENKKKNHML